MFDPESINAVPPRFGLLPDRTPADQIIAAAPAPRHAWYQDLYKQSGEFKDRWNSQDKDESGTSSIRRQLKQMSDECAWCEQHLDDGWQVDHWLPKAQFPLVVYHWENLLPACPACNRRKGAVVPPGLHDQQVVDPLLRPLYPGARPFIKGELLPLLSDRLLDPSHDDPAEHLEFIPAALSFRGLTDAGTFTVRHLFSEKDDAKRWARLGWSRRRSWVSWAWRKAPASAPATLMRRRKGGGGGAVGAGFSVLAPAKRRCRGVKSLPHSGTLFWMSAAESQRDGASGAQTGQGRDEA